NGPVDGPLLLLAHGAGAGADSDFMQTMATLLGQQGIRVVRFDFLYMQKARLEQKKRPPAPVAALLIEYRQVLEQLLAEHSRSVIIGGKSMGGRIASMLLQQDDCPSRVQGAVCLGYPF